MKLATYILDILRKNMSFQELDHQLMFIEAQNKSYSIGPTNYITFYTLGPPPAKKKVTLDKM